MKYLVRNSLMGFALVLSVCPTALVYAKESVPEKIGTGARKASDGVKRSVRAVEDKSCKMMHGELRCAGDEIKHKISNAKDSAVTNAKDIKNKVD